MGKPVTTLKRKPGRPKELPKVRVRLRLSEAQHAAYVEHGGEYWIKRVIDEEIARKPVLAHVNTAQAAIKLGVDDAM
jgi:hypothetical protein